MKKLERCAKCRTLLEWGQFKTTDNGYVCAPRCPKAKRTDEIKHISVHLSHEQVMRYARANPTYGARLAKALLTGMRVSKPKKTRLKSKAIESFYRRSTRKNNRRHL